MSRKRRRTPGNRTSKTGRRGFLLKLAGGGVIIIGGTASLLSSQSFSLIDADRDSNIEVASEGDGLVGIVGQGPVQKNQREAMVEFTNNGAETITITVSLDNTGDGTLYNNDGGSGSSVTLTLAPGNAQFVDIQASVTGTITYSVSVSSNSLNLDTNGSVEAEAGNKPGAIRIQKPKQNRDFTANRSGNEFEVAQVDIRDDDGDNDLDRIEFRIREGNSSGTAVASFDVTNPSGSRYNPSGNPALTIQPNAGYSIKPGTTYALTVTAFDADGNSAAETVEDTTSGTAPGTSTPTDTPTSGGCTVGSTNNPSAFQFSNLQGFDPKQGPDRWDIGQVQVQDNDGDNDLNKLKFEITDSGGTVRATRTIQLSGQQYQAQNLKINPDNPSYNVQKNETYTLTATVCDGDGNSRTETRQATA